MTRRNLWLAHALLKKKDVEQNKRDCLDYFFKNYLHVCKQGQQFEDYYNKCIEQQTKAEEKIKDIKEPGEEFDDIRDKVVFEFNPNCTSIMRKETRRSEEYKIDSSGLGVGMPAAAVSRALFQDETKSGAFLQEASFLEHLTSKPRAPLRRIESRELICYEMFRIKDENEDKLQELIIAPSERLAYAKDMKSGKYLKTEESLIRKEQLKEAIGPQSRFGLYAQLVNIISEYGNPIKDFIDSKTKPDGSCSLTLKDMREIQIILHPEIEQKSSSRPSLG